MTNSSLNAVFFLIFWPYLPTTDRISLPKHKARAGGEDQEDCAALKTCRSADRLEADLDASSELSFGYEFAQAEVMMKGMGSNGEPGGKKKKIGMAKEK